MSVEAQVKIKNSHDVLLSEKKQVRSLQWDLGVYMWLGTESWGPNSKALTVADFGMMGL